MMGEVSNLKRYNYILNNIQDGLQNKDRNEVRILDVGCGEGHIDNFLGEAGFKCITGVDVDADSIVTAKSKYSKVDFICDDIRNYLLSSKMNYWDFIICSEVLEHVSRPEDIVSHFTKILKDQGRLLVTIPNGYGPWEFYHRRAERKHYVNIDKEPQGRYHLQRFTHSSIVRMVSGEGFKLIRSANSNFISPVWPFNVPAYHSIDSFERIDCCLADYLPRCFSSGWYFCFELNKTIDTADNQLAYLPRHVILMDYENERCKNNRGGGAL